MEATAHVQIQCEDLGKVLGLDGKVLKTISTLHPSILQRHYEIMKCWIKNGGASWKKLVEALRSPLLNQMEVAKEIGKRHIGTHVVAEEVEVAKEIGKRHIGTHIVAEEDKPLTGNH